MPQYRRAKIEGSVFFFTVVLAERPSKLLSEKIDRFRRIYRTIQQRRPFETIAICVLPDHVHALWALPEGDADFSGRWRAIKTEFSKSLPADEPRSPMMASHGERGIWQRRYWEHTIRDERDYAAHMDYTHFNPVKHGLVENAADWPFSSFRRCVARGFYPEGWLGGGNAPLETGERP